jgi:hypothetical protein
VAHHIRPVGQGPDRARVDGVAHDHHPPAPLPAAAAAAGRWRCGRLLRPGPLQQPLDPLPAAASTSSGGLPPARRRRRRRRASVSVGGGLHAGGAGHLVKHVAPAGHAVLQLG